MTRLSQGLTPIQREQLGEIEKAIESLFHERAERWAISVGFVQRRSKITGSAFAQTLVFGFLNQPEATYTDLQQALELQGVQASPQAIEERMTPQAASLMRHLLEEVVAMVVNGEQECEMPILSSFNGVYLQDGSVLTKPVELQKEWQGSRHVGAEAGMWVQLRINWSNGQVTGPWLQDARASENRGQACIEETALPPGALYVTDNGYLLLKRMRALDEQGIFWLTSAAANLIITDHKGIRRDLPSFVTSRPQGPIDEWVWVGANKQLYCRLLVFPQETEAEHRKKQYEQKTRVKGRLPKGKQGASVSRKVRNGDA